MSKYNIYFNDFCCFPPLALVSSAKFSFVPFVCDIKVVSLISDSSEFRELKKYQRDFSSWCGECLLRKKERVRRLSSAKRQLAS